MKRAILMLAIAVTVVIAVEVIEGRGVGAQPVGLGEKIISAGADLELEILPFEAAFTSEIRLVLPIFGTATLATNQEVGKIIHLGAIFPAGFEVIFEIFVRETGLIFRTGPGERNPDGVAHATVAALGPSVWNIAFEDAAHADFDYNDVIFQVRPRAPLIFIPGILGSLLNEVGRSNIFPQQMIDTDELKRLTLDPRKPQNQRAIFAPDVWREEDIDVPFWFDKTKTVYKRLLKMLTDPSRGGTSSIRYATIPPGAPLRGVISARGFRRCLCSPTIGA